MLRVKENNNSYYCNFYPTPFNYPLDGPILQKEKPKLERQAQQLNHRGAQTLTTCLAILPSPRPVCEDGERPSQKGSEEEPGVAGTRPGKLNWGSGLPKTGMQHSMANSGPSPAFLCLPLPLGCRPATFLSLLLPSTMPSLRALTGLSCP